MGTKFRGFTSTRNSISYFVGDVKSLLRDTYKIHENWATGRSNDPTVDKLCDTLCPNNPKKAISAIIVTIENK